MSDRPVTVGLALDFGEVYSRNYRRTLGLAYSLTGDRSIAEDVTQDAFLQAHRNWDRVAHYDDPMAFVRRAVANRSVSRWRRLATERTVLARLRGRRDDVAEPELRDPEFWAAVRSLPTQQCQVVALRYIEDLSIDAIAEVLNVRPGTVKTQLFRARQRLATQLGCEPIETKGDES
jgi:RNA polymerase sigma-70 factor, ECF subfamily